MNNLIVVITTKNRYDFFKLALKSVTNQTEKPKEIICISDSFRESYIKEKKLCQLCKCTLLKDKHNNNYAGSLNTAIDYIVNKYVVKNSINPYDIIIAFLDDDDTWKKSYLKEMHQAILPNFDFVVSGLIWFSEDGIRNLSIPQSLTYKDFLVTNPKLQGSNTFIRLSTILKAGCFDENMNSTIDRDFFIRVMLLNPSFSILNKHLVNIDAFSCRKRLTTNTKDKELSLSKFFSKYEGLMKSEEKLRFFERGKIFNVNLTNEKVKHNLDFKINQKSNSLNYHEKYTHKIDRCLVICFIASNRKLFNRLVKQIFNLKIENFKIIVVKNFYCKSNESNGQIISIPIKKIVANINLKKYFFVEKDCIEKGLIKNIVAARTILNYHIYENTVSTDIIWILDDDMELNFLTYSDLIFSKIKTNIFEIIDKYKNKYDAVVGTYSLDAPVPTLSILRTSLLDYVYDQVLNKSNIFDNSLYFSKEYYYDLSDKTSVHLETPLKCSKKSSLKSIFSGKSGSRFLFTINKNFETFPISRGGNLLIFNKNILLIPNIPIKFDEFTCRRSDYLWVLLVAKLGYKLIQTNFSLSQNRLIKKFNIVHETKKEIEDILGSTFIKTFLKLKKNKVENFYKLFTKFFYQRISKFIISQYRVIGLLKLLNDNYYLKMINEEWISNFLRICIKLNRKSLINSIFL